MGAINSTHVLIVLSAVAIAYALWMICFMMRESRMCRTGREGKAAAPSSGEKRKNGDIVGKSLFVLSERISPPQAAVAAETEPDREKENSFAPANVPEHPRQIAPEELDDVFGDVPEGETNEPLDIDFPLSEEPFPEYEAEETEDEALPLTGASYAKGVRFEDVGEAYRRVVHNPSITDEQREETGRILLDLKGTDVYGVIVSGKPEREERVTTLIDTYLSAFHKRMDGRLAGSQPPLGDIPSGFNVRDFA